MSRLVFSTPRAAEFLERRALQSQTGQPIERFGDVVVKELVDNALDAAEAAGAQPEVDVTVELAGDVQRVTVTDNGPGIPEDVVGRILDFNVLVSDKAAYRSPTRGLQGNAWKTLLGIPHALGVAAPVVIEAQGVRHEITVSLDPGGNVAVTHDRGLSARTTGTSVTVPLPVEIPVDAGRWVQGFALTNPHAALSYLDKSADPDDAVSYKPTAPDGWRKPLPSEPTSIHWYDEAALTKLVFAHIAAARNGGRDVPIGEFVRTFDSLTSTAKAKQVREALPGVERLSDFERDPSLVGVLLKAMQAAAKLPKPSRLGRIGAEALRERLDAAFGVERFWYERKALEHDGIGWVIEVAVAETTGPGGLFYGTNYSPSFGDPLGTTWMFADDVAATGAGSFLARSDARPDYDNDHRRAAVVHVVTAAPEFTDKGKVALTVPSAVANVFGEVLAKASKTLRTERKRAEKDARAAAERREKDRRRAEREWRRRERAETEPRITLKDAVFTVMTEAIADASANGAQPFPTRNLFYSVRPLIQALTDAELKMNYFSQTLVVEYEREHGRIPGHYRDPRGELFEPHGGRSVRLGTREVADYQLPRHSFDKILYVEKEGFNVVFEATRLADRYDMAIATGKGQPVEAVRELFARAQAGSFKLFVLHDADPSGYSIARTIAEETARMPNHRVEVVDLGLTVADAVERDLQTERFTRRAELPWWMPDRLTETEREWFEGRQIGRKQWECTRVELNALKADLVPYIEEGLARHGATNKVIPPTWLINANTSAMVKAAVQVAAEDLIRELGLDPERIARDLARDFDRDRLRPKQTLLNRRLRRNSPESWRAALGTEVSRRLDRDKIKARVKGLIAERIEQAGGET